MVVGETVIEVPLPAVVPPHDTVYHCQVAPVPNVPPDKVIVEDAPEQISVGLAEADDAVTDWVLRVTVALTHVVILQSP